MVLFVNYITIKKLKLDLSKKVIFVFLTPIIDENC